MAHVLKNDLMEVTVDLPGEGYDRPRFDWTGKIRTVKYADRYVSGAELPDSAPDTPCGKGFYNEFGIDGPLGFDEVAPGEWFHKIGVGLLRKEVGPYDFHHRYEIKPAAFDVAVASDRIQITCRSAAANGYAYRLEKTISLLPSGFSMAYRLENTGERPIVTSEYSHNFLALDREPIGSDYVLQFPFQLDPARCDERVDPEALVRFGAQEIGFARTPREPFFFSNLSGGTRVAAGWTLKNRKNGLQISETGDFPTDAINLWGVGHVVSPELFIRLRVEPGQASTWSRVYACRE